MTSFIKNIGKGILYIFILPFFVVAIAIYGVFGMFVFLFECIKGIILFFTGRRLFDDLPEDKKAKEIIANAQQNMYKNNQPQPQPQPQVNMMYTTTPMYNQPQPQPQPQPLPESYFKQDDSIEAAVFKDDELGDNNE